MTGARPLALVAGLLMGLPSPAEGVSILWVGLCDAAHPGSQIPIPLDKGPDDGPRKACHAACGTLPDRKPARKLLGNTP